MLFVGLIVAVEWFFFYSTATCGKFWPSSLQKRHFTGFLTPKTSDSYASELLLGFPTWTLLKQRGLTDLYPQCCCPPSAHSISHPRPLTLPLSHPFEGLPTHETLRTPEFPWPSFPLTFLSYSHPSTHPQIPPVTLKFILPRVVS